MSDNITEFVKSAVSEKPVAAYNSINAELLNRTSSMLDDLKSEITSQIFNGEYQEDEDEIEEGSIKGSDTTSRKAQLKKSFRAGRATSTEESPPGTKKYRGKHNKWKNQKHGNAASWGNDSKKKFDSGRSDAYWKGTDHSEKYRSIYGTTTASKDPLKQKLNKTSKTSRISGKRV